MILWRRHQEPASPSTESGFGAAAYALLGTRIVSAKSHAVLTGRTTVATVTVRIDPGLDPLAHIAAARDGDEPWSSFSQPARDELSLATLGESVVVSPEPGDRFHDAARQCGERLEAAELDDLFDDPTAPPGAGVVWVGGFSFLEAGPWADAWRDLPSMRLALPRVSIARRAGPDPAARMTVAVAVEPDADPTAELARVEALVDRLRLDDDLGPTSFVPRDVQSVASSAAPPEHYEHAVSEAVSRIASGEFEKLVLAREVVLRSNESIDPVNAVLGLRESFPECTTFAVGSGSSAFIGASPELLVRREGRRASTMALAGSARRGGDAETDALLGRQLLESEKNRSEHSIVVKRIERTLGRISAWVATGEKPELVKVKNIQHLATPIRAQLTEPRPAIELAGLLHPTPAVGGEPWPEAADAIRSLEGFDRGWYTGGVGWMDFFEDGEFHVALRSAMIDGNRARLFAGAGIVADSDPAAELAETETKLQALLPVLSRA
jgi:salicylate biosynthesis isochorismate synthase/menaquinone-specific isochorismate synthase